MWYDDALQKTSHPIGSGQVSHITRKAKIFLISQSWYSVKADEIITAL